MANNSNVFWFLRLPFGSDCTERCDPQAGLSKKSKWVETDWEEQWRWRRWRESERGWAIRGEGRVVRKVLWPRRSITVHNWVRPKWHLDGGRGQEVAGWVGHLLSPRLRSQNNLAPSTRLRLSPIYKGPASFPFFCLSLTVWKCVVDACARMFVSVQKCWQLRNGPGVEALPLFKHAVG